MSLSINARPGDYVEEQCSISPRSTMRLLQPVPDKSGWSRTESLLHTDACSSKTDNLETNYFTTIKFNLLRTTSMQIVSDHANILKHCVVYRRQFSCVRRGRPV